MTKSVLCIVVSGIVLSGCESSEEKTIAAGQACLDSARNATDAQSCLDIVGQLDTPAANTLKCSAMYIKKGFTASRFSQAFEQLKNNPNGGGGGAVDPTGATISFLAFTGGATTSADRSDAALTYSYCSKSGSRSLERLASLTKFATGSIALGKDIGSSNCSSLAVGNNTQLASCLTDVKNNASSPTQKEELGNMVIALQQSYCNSGSSYSGNNMCNELNSAINSGGGNPVTIINNFLTGITTN